MGEAWLEWCKGVLAYMRVVEKYLKTKEYYENGFDLYSASLLHFLTKCFRIVRMFYPIGWKWW